MNKKMGMILGGVGLVVVIVLIFTLSKGANWSSEAQELYMDECVTNGADKEICQCTMSALDSKYPNLPNLKDSEIDSEIDIEKFLTFTYEAALNCYDDLGIALPDTFKVDDGSIDLD